MGLIFTRKYHQRNGTTLQKAASMFFFLVAQGLIKSLTQKQKFKKYLITNQLVSTLRNQLVT